MVRPWVCFFGLVLIIQSCYSKLYYNGTQKYFKNETVYEPYWSFIPTDAGFIPEDIRGNWNNLQNYGQLDIEAQRIIGIPIGKVFDNGTVRLEYPYDRSWRKIMRLSSPPDEFIIHRLNKNVILIIKVFITEIIFKDFIEPYFKSLNMSYTPRIQSYNETLHMYYLCSRDALEAKKTLQKQCPRIFENQEVNMNFSVTERRLKNKNTFNCPICISRPDTILVQTLKGNNIQYIEYNNSSSWSLSMSASVGSPRVKLTLQMECQLSFAFPDTKPGDIYLVGRVSTTDTFRNGTQKETEYNLTCFLKRSLSNGGILLVQGAAPDCTVVGPGQHRLTPENGYQFFNFYPAQ